MRFTKVLLFDPNKKFYKGNLHAHTSNSDGHRTPEEVVALFREQNYDFLALTDHWKRTADEELRDGMLLLPGIEIDYSLPAEVIHIVGIGVSEQILEEKEHRALGPQHGVDAILACGGRAILAHPAWSLNTPETLAALRHLTATEIYNTVSGTPWNGDRADSTSLLDIAASRGCLLRTVAADDCHFYNGDQCQSYIMAQLDELSLAGVLKALDEGAYYATRGPRIHQVEIEEGLVTVTCSPANLVTFHSNLVYSGGRSVTGDGMTQASYKIRKGERFLRIRVTDAQGRHAWVNPIALT